MVVLLRGAPDLKALSLKSGGVSPLGSLASCSLRHLALQYPGARWLELLPDLRGALPSLESLKLVSELSCSDDDIELKSAHLPDVRVKHTPKLRHLELQKQSLPNQNRSRHHLSMRLHADNRDMLWGDSLGSAVKRTTAIWLGRGKLKAWPAGLERFPKLRLLDVEVDECMCTPPLDLGHLRRIPHVRLLSTGCLRLCPYQRILGEPRAHCFGWYLCGICNPGRLCHPHQALQLLLHRHMSQERFQLSYCSNDGKDLRYL